MISVFDTHLPLIYALISYGFETGTHPPFSPMSYNMQFFLKASLILVFLLYHSFEAIATVFEHGNFMRKILNDKNRNMTHIN